MFLFRNAAEQGAAATQALVFGTTRALNATYPFLQLASLFFLFFLSSALCSVRRHPAFTSFFSTFTFLLLQFDRDFAPLMLIRRQRGQARGKSLHCAYSILCTTEQRFVIFIIYCWVPPLCPGPASIAPSYHARFVSPAPQAVAPVRRLPDRRACICHLDVRFHPSLFFLKFLNDHISALRRLQAIQ